VKNTTKSIMAAAVAALLVACGLSTLGSGSSAPGDEGGAPAEAGTTVDASNKPDALSSDTGTSPSDGGADACNADLSSDPKNCGACGHDCLGGGCEKHACLPFRVAFTDASAESIATDDAGVYWVVPNGSAVLQCPPAGCAAAPGVLSASFVNTVALVAAGQGLSVLDTNDLQSVTTPGGAASIVFPSSSTINNGVGLCTDGNGHLLVLSSNSGGTRFVARIFPDGGGEADLASTNQLSAIGCGAGHVLWMENISGPDAIFACDDPADCGAPGSIYPGPNTNETHIVASGDQAYFTRRDRGTLNRCAIAGCPEPTVLYTGNDLNGIGIDDRFVYFTSGSGGVVARCSHDGCAASYTVLAKNQINPHALIVTDTAIYWATDSIPPSGSDAGTMPAIYRVAK
jgi:hypothetical protein